MCNLHCRVADSPDLRMATRRMKVSKCPSDTLTMTNRAIVNPRDFDKQVSSQESGNIVGIGMFKSLHL